MRLVGRLEEMVSFPGGCPTAIRWIEWCPGILDLVPVAVWRWLKHGFQYGPTGWMLLPRPIRRWLRKRGWRWKWRIQHIFGRP